MSETTAELPMIYDVVTDMRRPATQADIDRLVTAERCFGALRYLMRGFVDEPKGFTTEKWNAYLTMLNLLAQKMDDKRIGQLIAG